MARGQNYECSKCLSFKPTLVMTKRTETIRAYDAMETMLVNLIGYDMKKLIELFAAGYTLQPPKYMSLKDLEKHEDKNETLK